MYRKNCRYERRKACGNPFFFKGITDSFALITLAVPKSCYSLGARTTFDRGASFCSLYPAPQALATSLRITKQKSRNILSVFITDYVSISSFLGKPSKAKSFIITKVIGPPTAVAIAVAQN